MRIALADLKIEHLTVLYPGDSSYSIADRISAVPLSALCTGDPGVLLPRRTRKCKA